MHLRSIARGLFSWLLLTNMLMACQPGKIDDHQTATIDSMAVHDSITLNSPLDSSFSKEPDYSDCVRAHAEPIIKNTVHPQSTFELNKDGHTGKETITFQNGDKLVIRNWGCEYYILTFRFETNRFAADTTDTAYWLDKAVTLMTSVESGLDAPMDIPTGTMAIKNLLNGEAKYNLGEEIVYVNEDIREYVTIDRIQKINDKRFAVEVSYSMGPL